MSAINGSIIQGCMTFALYHAATTKVSDINFFSLKRENVNVSIYEFVLNYKYNMT